MCGFCFFLENAHCFFENWFWLANQLQNVMYDSTTLVNGGGGVASLNLPHFQNTCGVGVRSTHAGPAPKSLLNWAESLKREPVYVPSSSLPPPTHESLEGEVGRDSRTPQPPLIL